MTSRFPPFRARLARLLASFAIIAPLAMPPLAAQTLGSSTSGFPALADVDPVTALSRYLRMLAANPRDLASLTGAGRAALAVGDANAALGFYARAEELAPRNGRIKAGLASALVQMEQPRAALKLFDEAVALGVPAGDIAADRGLANDLNGDGRRAQADYTIALRARDDDETVRRLALSMAVSGDRDGALAVLSPLLRKRDGGAERARAFILALTGDQAGAATAVRGAMPGPQAAVMTSFMSRLAKLNPAQKALAVNFGYFPSDGRAYTAAELFADARAAPLPSPGSALGGRDPRRDLRGDTPLIPVGEALGPRLAANVPVSTAPRRRPGQLDTAEVLPPPHVLSAPIPGVTPVPAGSTGAGAGAIGRPGALALRQGLVPAPASARPVAGAATSANRVAVSGTPLAATPMAVAPASLAAATVVAPASAALLAGSARASGPPPVSAMAAPGTTVQRANAASSPPEPGFSAFGAAAAPSRAPASTPMVTASVPVQPAVSGGSAIPAPAVASAGMAATAGAASSPPTPPVAAAAPERVDASSTSPVATGSGLRGAPVIVTAAGPALTAPARPAPAPIATVDLPPALQGPPAAAAPAQVVERAAPRPATRAATIARRAEPAGVVAGAEAFPARTGKAAAGKPDASGRAGSVSIDAKTAVSKGAKGTRLASLESRNGKPAEAKGSVRDTLATAKDAKGKNARGDADDKAAKAGKGARSAGLADAKAARAGKDANTAKDAKDTKPATKAKPATSERYWVQVASGANKANLDKAWGEVKGKAPKLLGGQATYTAPWRASNRLLIGPFKTEGEAQAKVNALAKAGVSGIQFTTRAGSDVEKVAAK